MKIQAAIIVIKLIYLLGRPAAYVLTFYNQHYFSSKWRERVWFHNQNKPTSEVIFEMVVIYHKPAYFCLMNINKFYHWIPTSNR